MAVHTDLDQVIDALHAADALPRTPDEARLLLRTCQLVATGRPVTPSRVTRLARELRIPLEFVTTFLARVSEFDAQGNVVGILGLSQQVHPHRFDFGYRSLTTWCAWDALYLPPLLGVTAHVEASCPVTGAGIHFTVSPTRVEHYDPAGTVLSFFVPALTQQARSSVQDMWRAFCCQIRFFSSAEAAAIGLKDALMTPMILSVEEGYDLGRKALERAF